MTDVLKGGTYNCRIGRKRSRVADFVAHLFDKHGLDYLLVQEAHPYVRAFRRLKGIEVICEPGIPVNGKQESYLLVRTGVEISEPTRHRLSEHGWFGTTGRPHPPRWGHSALLDGWLRVLSLHQPPSVHFRDSGVVGPERRKRCFFEVSQTLVDLGLGPFAEDEALIYGGDWNEPTTSRGEFSPHWVAEQLGMETHRTKVATGHGGGRIDWPMSRGCEIHALRVLDNNGGSDHEVVLWEAHRLPERPAEPELPEEEEQMQFVSREQWGARPGATPRTHPIGYTKGVTLHWEGPKMGGFAHSRCARLVRSIQRFHQVNRGWADIAYNLVVCPHGVVFEGRGANVRSAANGYTSVNDDWYAVCYLGGQGDGFTEEGKAGFKAAVAYLRDKGHAGPAVNGHRDHKPTTCPGDQIYRWLRTTDFDNIDTRDWYDMASKDDLADVLRKTEFTVVAGGETKEWTLERFFRHIEEEQDETQRLLKALVARDADALAEAVAAKVDVTVAADSEVIKQAVKDALAEGTG